MFSSLKNILNKDWQDNIENRDIIFITENEYSTYQVFSVYQIEEEDYYIRTNFAKNEFASFVNKLKKRSIYDFDIEVGEDDQILTLSTCGKNNNYRVILHAKRIK